MQVCACLGDIWRSADHLILNLNNTVLLFFSKKCLTSIGLLYQRVLEHSIGNKDVTLKDKQFCKAGESIDGGYGVGSRHYMK